MKDPDDCKTGGGSPPSIMQELSIGVFHIVYPRPCGVGKHVGNPVGILWKHRIFYTFHYINYYISRELGRLQEVNIIYLQ